MTKPVGQAKPQKPYKTFPLSASSSGSWIKQIAGKRHYFGPWHDPEGALEKYRREFPYLHAGIEPPRDSLTLRELLNAFDDEKSSMLGAGRISKRTYDEYMAVCTIIADVLGKTRPVESITPLDLKQVAHRLARGKSGQPVSPVTTKRMLTFARMVFKFANEILDCNVKYKQALRSPEKKLIRERRVAAGERMFEAAEIRTLIENADPNMLVVTLLGINCGFGPTDMVELTTDRIRDGFIDYPRPKTGVQRRCPLWPETQAAITAVASKTHVLNGKVWNRHVMARDFRKLCKKCGVYQQGRTELYSLRRTFETVAKNAAVNQSVIDRIMGHERPVTSEVYVQRTFDRQLIRCTEFVRDWIFGRVIL